MVTNARPEIADYEFTTLTPNLGVADIDESTLLIADIPGLIEGAADGKGLGDQFLRHVERTAVLLHLIDAYSNDIAGDYKTIRSELGKYSDTLVARPEVVALTKTEGLDKDMIAMQTDELQKVIAEGTRIMTISSTAGRGLNELLRQLNQQVKIARDSLVEEEAPSSDVPVLTLSNEQNTKAWSVTKEGDQYVVTGEKIEKFARRTNFEQFEGVNRLRDIMKKMGISHELIRQGAQGDSPIRIGSAELTLVEQ